MEYFITIANFFAIYAMLALSLNVLVGYTGLVSLAHAAFYGIGAYATAILLTKMGVNFFLSVGVGILCTLVVSGAIGLVLARFKDDYYMLVSLGFMSIFTSAAVNLTGVTNGPLGIAGIVRPHLGPLDFSSSGALLCLNLFFLALVFLLCRALVQSSFGRALKGIREDETAVQVFGYRTQRYKLVVFIFSALFASLAGSLYAVHVSFIDPGTFVLNESIVVLSMIILGGLANLSGSLLGALFLTLLPELLRFVGLPQSSAGQIRELIYGLLLVVLMMYRPQGLRGEYRL